MLLPALALPVNAHFRRLLLPRAKGIRLAPAVVPLAAATSSIQRETLRACFLVRQIKPTIKACIDTASDPVHRRRPARYRYPTLCSSRALVVSTYSPGLSCPVPKLSPLPTFRLRRRLSRRADEPAMTPSPQPSSQAAEPRPPRSTQRVSVNIAEGDKENGRRFELRVSECVETKTVTTTTRLTRKFPRIFLRDPAPLETLDHKEYPLASKPTPPELLEFSYEEQEEERLDDETSNGELEDENDQNQDVGDNVSNS
ncbi:hypothetical protein E4U21_002294, partial [Claviceps maximensis]